MFKLDIEKLDGSVLHIIDSSSIARTGFYYFKDLGCDVNGEFVNTGAMYALMKIFKEININDKIVFCWDSRNNQRKEEDENYKNNRVREGLEDYYTGINTTREIMEDCGFISVWAEGYEADDFVIAVKEYYEGIYDNIVIHTGDHDLAQLIDTKTYIKVPVTKRNDICLENYEQILGIPYNTVLLYKSLVGCSSDNVKGVKGFGVKSFQRLIREIEEDFNLCLIREDKCEEHVIRELCGFNDKQIQEAIDALSLVAPRVPYEFEFNDENRVDKERMLYYLNMYKMKSIIRCL